VTLAAVAVLLAMTLAACVVRPGASGTSGASGVSATSPTATGGLPTPTGGLPISSGVRGTVKAGPTCPVVTNPPNPGCADRPVAGAVLVFKDASGAEVARVTSAADGTFSLELAPGAYQLVAQQHQGLMGTPAPMEVRVDAGGPMTEVTVSYDTGIR
jgi:hypothetical protein